MLKAANVLCMDSSNWRPRASYFDPNGSTRLDTVASAASGATGRKPLPLPDGSAALGVNRRSGNIALKKSPAVAGLKSVASAFWRFLPSESACNEQLKKVILAPNVVVW